MENITTRRDSRANLSMDGMNGEIY